MHPDHKTREVPYSMRTIFTAACAAFVLAAGVAGAAVTVIDSCEDTNYTTIQGAGESFTLANVPGSEGTNGLSITYNYTAQDAWYKDAYVTRTFSTPVDLSAMESLNFDLKVPTAGPEFMVIVVLTDDKNFRLSAEMWTALASARPDYETFNVPLSQLVKNEWKSQGRAINMRKVKSVSINILNGANLPAAGSFTFMVDNISISHGSGRLNETVIEDFESYANTAAIQAAYASGGNATAKSIELETANPFAGTKAAKLNGEIQGQWFGANATTILPSTLDVSAAKYFKISAFGNNAMATYNPTVSIILRDGAGNHLVGHTWLWGEVSEWATFYMPFAKPATSTPSNSCWVQDNWDAGGDCNLSDIREIRLAFSPQSSTPTYPITTSVLFDNIIVGDETAASVADWSVY